MIEYKDEKIKEELVQLEKRQTSMQNSEDANQEALELDDANRKLLINSHKKFELVKLSMEFAKLGDNVKEDDPRVEYMLNLMNDLGCNSESDIVEIVKSILLPSPKNLKTLADMGLSISGNNYKRKGDSNFK